MLVVVHCPTCREGTDVDAELDGSGVQINTPIPMTCSKGHDIPLGHTIATVNYELLVGIEERDAEPI